jgi:hypothetical protein
MVQSQSPLRRGCRLAGIFAISTVSLTTYAGQEPSLPSPYRLKPDEMLAGNPLAEYAEMLRLEKEFLGKVTVTEAFAGLLPPSAGPRARSYVEARATAEAVLGLIQRSLRTQSIGDYRAPARAPFVTSSLQRMRAVPAIPFLLREAEKHNWVMLGEEHMKPQTRTLITPLLRGLRKKGFRYFAAETFEEGIEDTSKRGYATYSTGAYTRDPVFAEAVREALRLGYTLVKYDDTPEPNENPTKDPMFFQNFRENAQAARLKERILDKDPKAKVLVWGGRSHVNEEGGKFPDGSEIKTMGLEFKKMTGIDPLTSYLPTFVEAAGPEWESPEYKWATQAKRVTVPTVFLDRSGRPYHRGGTDVAVFFPRTTYVCGRPDWLVRELGRRPTDLPASLVKGNTMLLAQAFYPGEPPTAIPVDQIALMPGDPLPQLMLPNGKFDVRVINPTGAVVGRATVTTR